MTVTKPTPEAQAAAWAKEHADWDGSIGVLARDVRMILERAYLAGYAAGVEAGREAEGARTCRWKWIEGDDDDGWQPACSPDRYSGEFMVGNADECYPFCQFCGGRIEVAE